MVQEALAHEIERTNLAEIACTSGDTSRAETSLQKSLDQAEVGNLDVRRQQHYTQARLYEPQSLGILQKPARLHSEEGGRHNGATAPPGRTSTSSAPAQGQDAYQRGTTPRYRPGRKVRLSGSAPKERMAEDTVTARLRPATASAPRALRTRRQLILPYVETDSPGESGIRPAESRRERYRCGSSAGGGGGGSAGGPGCARDQLSRTAA